VQDAGDPESQDIGDECCICLSQSPAVLFLPCGHGACYRPCFDMMLNGLHHGLDRIKCPICRREVQTVEHLSPDQIREISQGTASDEFRTDSSDPIVQLQMRRVREGRARLLREAHERQRVPWSSVPMQPGRYNEFASFPSPHNSDEDEEADYESVSNWHYAPVSN
jgi:hypothetical protein